MAQNIILKRSALPGKVPNNDSLKVGEIAVNTYDGKLFVKRSGNTDSVETILTTNSVTTGSITITQTGSFGELKVIEDANINRDLYVTRDIIGAGDIDISGDITGSSVLLDGGLILSGDITGSSVILSGSLILSGDITGSSALLDGDLLLSGDITGNSALLSGSLILSGSQTITNNLTVLGAVNARQFNISVISSSVLFESGSSNFGNSDDDTHSFTGSVSIDGELTATSFAGNGSGLTNLSIDISTTQLNDIDGNNIPQRSFALLYLACAISDAVDVDLDFNI